MSETGTRQSNIRRRVHALLDPGDAEEEPLGRWVDGILVALILANVAAVVLESVGHLNTRYHAAFAAFDTFSIAVFTVEYVARVWTVVERHSIQFRQPVMGRLRYMLTPMALVDLLAILPAYLIFLFDVDLRFLRVIRLIRLLKLTRYSPALETVVVVLVQSRRQLGAAAVIMAVLLVLGGGVAHLLEHEAQPEAFGTIPDAMWWAIATLTTVGFGDVTPVTPAGKVFGAVLMVLGVGMYALPTGILATGFAREFRKRDFNVTWRLVAGVPLFGRLEAMDIADISALLHSKVVPVRYTIVRRGESAEAMYFIISGEVEVDIGMHPRRLGPGDHFGEIALLKRTQRTATVTAITECQLMSLEVADLDRLLREHPKIHDELTRIMEIRLAELEAAGMTP